ncbi:hypothetical protein N9L18_01095 [Candidatus Pacebacteria bacterium]|nr:hypothetical protein [Candidatus Paceibacterota bacterium]
MKTIILCVTLVACVMATTTYAQSDYTYDYSSHESYGDWSTYTNHDYSYDSSYSEWSGYSSGDGYYVYSNQPEIREINDDNATEPGGENRDTLRAGLALAQSFWDSYEIDLYYWDEDNWVHMEATANLQNEITSLKIDDEVILQLGDDPLPGIPIPDSGMTNVYVNVTGYGNDGNAKVHGSENLNIVDESHPINVVLRPLDTIEYIPYTELPDGVDPSNLMITTSDGHWVGYYIDLGYFKGFYFWVDPTVDPLRVSVVDRETGYSYETFVVDPVEDSSEIDPSVSTNFSLVGKVHRFILRDNESYSVLQSGVDGWTRPSQIEGDVVQDVVPAKSFIYEDKEGSGAKLYLFGDVSADAVVKISAYVNGEFHSSASVLADSFYNDVTHSLRVTGDGTYKAIVFVVEILAGETASDFYFELSSHHGGKG